MIRARRLIHAVMREAVCGPDRRGARNWLSRPNLSLFDWQEISHRVEKFGLASVRDYLVETRPLAWVLELIEINPEWWRSRVLPELQAAWKASDAARLEGAKERDGEVASTETLDSVATRSAGSRTPAMGHTTSSEATAAAA